MSLIYLTIHNDKFYNKQMVEDEMARFDGEFIFELSAVLPPWIASRSLLLVLPQYSSLCNEEDLFVEQVLEEEQNEQLYLQDQIEDFEQWEESNRMGSASDDVGVWCPMCQLSMLLLSDDADRVVHFTCPNASCSCRFETTTLMAEHPVDNLREKLRTTIEDHARTCSCFLRFADQDCNHDGHARKRLVASCDVCGSVATVV